MTSSTTARPKVVMRHGRPRRLARRDMVWRDNEVVWSAVYDGSAPDAEAASAALRDLATAAPAAHVLRYVDADRGTWHRPSNVDLLVDRLVVSRPESLTPDQLSDVARADQQEPLGDLPFRFTVGANWTSLRFSHGLGDAGTMWPLHLGLTSPDRMAACLASDGDPSWPLIRALWHTFGRRPSAVGPAVRTDRARFPLVADGVTPYTVPTINIVGRRSAALFRRELAAHRKSAAPGASPVGVLVARAAEATRQAGLTPFPGIGIVSDARRYLPGRRYAGGNFTAGTYLQPRDIADPLAVTQSIDAYVASGRPLLTLALMAMTARGGPRREPVWREPPSGPRTLISFSHVGKLPWFLPPPVSALVLGKPVGRHGLAIVTHELGPYLYASVTYDERYVARPAAEAVADAITSLD